MAELTVVPEPERSYMFFGSDTHRLQVHARPFVQRPRGKKQHLHVRKL